MRAANMFRLEVENYLQQQTSPEAIQQLQIRVNLFGSLAHTGIGHGTHRAVLAGLLGDTPQYVNIDRLNTCFDHPDTVFQLPFSGFFIPFVASNIYFDYLTPTSKHPNTLSFNLLHNNEILFTSTYYSVGGGFIEKEESGSTKSTSNVAAVPKYAYNHFWELLRHHEQTNIPVETILLENEIAVSGLTEAEIFEKIDQIMAVMHQSVQRGLLREGVLPGGLNVKRRAKNMYADALACEAQQQYGEALFARLNAYALATSEENAAGQMVVTAPTNGAAGILPAALEYLRLDCKIAEKTLQRGLFMAAMIGFIIKDNASISGAELGCQAEVGSAAAMAAGLFSYCLGGDIHQIATAAEIAMEHHLGMTCDPVNGLVQVPCIERNANGVVKAFNAYLLAKRQAANAVITLDEVIETMRRTGEDLSDKYKETAQGGLAKLHKWTSNMGS